MEGEKSQRGEANAKREAAEAPGGGEPVGNLAFIGVPVVLGGQAPGHQAFGGPGENLGKLGELAAFRSGFRF